MYPRVTRKNPRVWVGVVSEFHGYFPVGYPKRHVILGIKPVGKILALVCSWLGRYFTKKVYVVKYLIMIVR